MLSFACAALVVLVVGVGEMGDGDTGVGEGAVGRIVGEAFQGHLPSPVH